jgi:hypothetical protein
MVGPVIDASGLKKIRHFQGFKTGNLTIFLADVFTPNSHPIGQTLGMAGLPTQMTQFTT